MKNETELEAWVFTPSPLFAALIIYVFYFRAQLIPINLKMNGNRQWIIFSTPTKKKPPRSMYERVSVRV